jgi:NADH dehydrogenase (ubiquinone) 1 alpha subcomplex subunit 5
MRSTLRLFAAVSRNTTLYSEPGLPTGLTGLFTHYSPRSTLLYLYSTTLDKLHTFPEHSVYRQSAEALTRHRMSIVESIKPAGLTEWQQRVSQLVDEHPNAFKRVNVSDGAKGEFNIVYNAPPPENSFKTEDDAVNAAYKAKPQAEGPREQEDRDVRDRGKELEKDIYGDEVRRLRVEAEPALTMEQVAEVEQRIGAGLIEEVIAVAEGERRLVDTLAEYKV